MSYFHMIIVFIELEQKLSSAQQAWTGSGRNEVESYHGLPILTPVDSFQQSPRLLMAHCLKKDHMTHTGVNRVGEGLQVNRG